MKRIASLLVVVMVLVSVLSGCENFDTKNDVQSTVSSQNSAPEEASKPAESAQDKTTDNAIGTGKTLTDRYMREIDGAYKEESKLPEYTTTIGMVELADKYAAKWKQVADEYYNKIMEYDGIVRPSEDYYSSDDLHTFVKNMKVNWDEYSEEQSENYRQTLFAIYSGGTISGPIFAHYKYELQMEWALQILDICQQLHIE